ncbi:MAG: hypothetical protein M3P18_05965 [Actinomycetota bacterium]|nr:hypothetical protein [Actinomycetota bacterium]
MSDDLLELARAATTPDLQDIAHACDVVLGTVTPTNPAHTDHMLAAIAERFKNEPLPETADATTGFIESDLRRVHALTAGVVAISMLQGRGVLLPLVGQYGDHLSWSLSYHAPGGGGRTLNVDAGRRYRLAPAYQLAPHVAPTPAIDAPATFLEHLPAAMGPKVRRVLREAVDAYRSGRLLATAVLLGIASEAAWGQLARVVLATTSDVELGKRIDAPIQSAAAIQRRTDELLREMGRLGPLLNAIDPLEQIYRDLRNYGAHHPDETFDESRFTHTTVGNLLNGCVDYFTRLYGLVDILVRP